MWRIGRERALLAGGQASLLLQLAHPLVASAVAGHSEFRSDPLRRLRRTLEATLMITFGDTEQAKAAAEGVAAVHRRVHGRLPNACGAVPAGTPYNAADPELGMWVHATLVATALEVFGRFVRPLSAADRGRYYQESKRFAAMFGVPAEAMPDAYRGFEDYVRSMVEGRTLRVCDEARRLSLEILRPEVPGLRWAAGLGRVLTAGLLPPRFRRAYGLPWGLPQRILFESARRSARVGLRATPDRVRYWPHYLAARSRLTA